MSITTSDDFSIQDDALPRARMEAADLIIHYLEQIGVDYVFGVPGGAIEPLYNALARSQRRNGIRAVPACHEAAAAYMADGYQRESGRLGVCIATSGPGATNLITGVACAYDNNIPMLVITGQPTLASFGRGALQESSCTGVNVVGMFKHCTRYNSLVSHIDQLETKLVTALLKAHQSSCGPVHLSIPVDILRTVITRPPRDYPLLSQIEQQNSLCDDHGIRQLEMELLQQQKPLFFIGSGTADAIESIMQLVEQCDARFITTPDAKGLINVRHPYYRGVFGLGGHTSAMLTLRHHSGAIVAFGTGFGEFASGGWNESLMSSKLIHVDNCSENLLQTPMARLHVRGNLQEICSRVAARLKHQLPPKKPLNYHQHNGINPNIVLEDASKYHSSAVPIKPQRLMKELSEQFPRNTRFVADAGNSMMWAPHYLQPNSLREKFDSSESRLLNLPDRRSRNANWLRLTLNFAPMGWAIGAAIGVARANPGCPVVCITGDGSYLMSGQEISVAARERLPVYFVILNDGVYGMVMHGQRLAGAEPIGFQLPQVNFALMAQSLGIEGHVITEPDDFNQLGLSTHDEKRGPVLLDVRIDREEVPPMIMRLKTLGTAEESLAS